MAERVQAAFRAATGICALMGLVWLAGCEGTLGASPPHAAPANPSAEAEEGRVELTWDAVEGADRYVILWDDVQTGPRTYENEIKDVEGTEYTHTGLVDLRAAVQQELYSEPSLLSFGAAGSSGAERVLQITNVSSRRLSVSVGQTAIAPKGVEIAVDPQRVRIRPGRSTEIVVRASTSQLSSEAGAATGELVLRTGDSPEVHVPSSTDAVIVVNHGTEAVTIARGDRIAQLVVARLPEVTIVAVDELPGTERGAGGFGHTGRA